MAKVDMLMPQMGESINEGTVIRWLKKEGERVEKDEVLLEISTDKVDSEIPSPHAGIVRKIVVAEGETVQVGSVVAEIDAEGSQASETEQAAPVEVTEVEPEPAPAPAPEPVVQEVAAPPAVQSTASNGGGVVDMSMPQMGESITEGTVIKWLKKKGEPVERDEVLLEISTDKVDSEIPSPHGGVLQEILVKEGDTVAVGATIARIATSISGTPAPPKPAESLPAKPAATATPSEVQPVRPAVAVATQAPARVPASSGNGAERRFYSPLVRSIARVEGISGAELETIQGTGANGRVTKKDILNFLDSRSLSPGAVQPAAPATVVPAAATPPAQSEFSDDRIEVIPMDTMRRSIAKHMVASVQTSPHVFMMTEADMTGIVTYRTQHKEAFLKKTGTKLTFMPFITYACAKALQDYPLVNASLDGDRIIRKKYINIGIAVALENNGLIVPVIKNADGLNIVGLARSINDLAARARSKKLKPDEVQDGTFSITNMGTFGSLIGFPIINQPQVAILGLGTIQKRPVVVNDAIGIRSMLYISLSFDHRIVDGALAGQFIERVAHYLSDFDMEDIL